MGMDGSLLTEMDVGERITILIRERITSREEYRASDVGNSGRHAAVLSQLPDGVGRGEPVLVAWNDPSR